VLGRMVGDYLSRDLKQTVVVENKAGAQGAIGAEVAARAEPDGYTLFFTAASIVVLNPQLYKKLPYDPVKDFRMLAIITDLPVLMEVHPSVPAKTVAEFVAYVKQNPGKLNFGSAGTGGTTHLAGEMFRQMAGVDMVHVAYKGAGPALTDLLSGNIQLMFDTLGTALPPVKAGLLRPLAVSSAQRIPDLPDVPTMAEAGYPQYAVSVWYGVAAQSKLPDEIVQKLKASLDRALSDDTFRASLDKSGFAPLRPKSLADIDKFIDADRKLWAGVIKALNISLD
jgi:tripartite-type tricarboxylate transporter receptor subunit TctC